MNHQKLCKVDHTILYCSAGTYQDVVDGLRNTLVPYTEMGYSVVGYNILGDNLSGTTFQYYGSIILERSL